MTSFIKTVKSLLGLCSIATLFYFSVTLASVTNPEIQQLLAAPSAVDHFKRQSQNRPENSPQKSPLVIQAEFWTAKPPKPPEPRRIIAKETHKPEPKPEIRPQVSTPKFTVIATSLSRDDAGDSLALISELGGQQRWVHIGDQIGHLVVENIHNGKILYKDGDRQEELAIAEPEPVKLVTPTTTPKRPSYENTRFTNRLAVNEPKQHHLDLSRTYSRPLPRSLRKQ